MKLLWRWAGSPRSILRSRVSSRVAGCAAHCPGQVVAQAYKADLNVIDYGALKLQRPVIAYDLPAGGRRLDQTADG
jgi:N-acyl-D-amino-acid deacylase